jgi:hypothetical protein
VTGTGIREDLQSINQIKKREGENKFIFLRGREYSKNATNK